MKQTFYLIAASLLVLAACTKPNKPVACTEKVTFQGHHICYGYLLQRNDGSYLRTIEYAPNSNYEPILAGSQLGETLVIGYTGPQERFVLDCAVVDTTYSKSIRVECLTKPSTQKSQGFERLYFNRIVRGLNRESC